MSSVTKRAMQEADDTFNRVLGNPQSMNHKIIFGDRFSPEAPAEKSLDVESFIAHACAPGNAQRRVAEATEALRFKGV